MVATGIIKGRREESKKWEFWKARKHKSPGDGGFAKTFGSSKEKGGGGGGITGYGRQGILSSPTPQDSDNYLAVVSNNFCSYVSFRKERCMQWMWRIPGISLPLPLPGAIPISIPLSRPISVPISVRQKISQGRQRKEGKESQRRKKGKEKQ